MGQEAGSGFYGQANAKANKSTAGVFLNTCSFFVVKKRHVDLGLFWALGRQTALFKKYPQCLRQRSKCLKLSLKQ